MVETMPGRFDPLHLRVWSIDHNDKYFTKRYRDISIDQFSGSSKITQLQCIPAGYLPNESDVRQELIERGRKYWELGQEPRQTVLDGEDSVSYEGTELR